MKILCLAASMLALAGAARAGEGFDAFQSFCFATHADTKAALAAADAAGWTKLDSAQVPIPANPTFKLESYETRVQAAGGGFRLLIVGRGEATMRQGAAAVPAQACIVVVRPVEADAAERLRGLVGLPPAFSQPGGKMTLYAYAEGDHGPAPIGGPQAAQGLYAMGKLRMAISAENNGTSSLSLVNLNP